MSEQMTKEQAADYLETRIGCEIWWNDEAHEVFELAISALRDDQPCEKCAIRDAHIDALKDQCAAWENAWSEVYDVAGKDYKGKIIEAMDRLDPRRKPKSETQAKECLTDKTQRQPCKQCEELGSVEKRLRAFERTWDELTNLFDGFWGPAIVRDTLVEIMEKWDPRRKQTADEPTPEETEKVKAFVDKVLNGTRRMKDALVTDRYRYPYSAEINIDGTGESAATFDQEVLEGIKHVGVGWYDVRWQEAIMNNETNLCGILFHVALAAPDEPAKWRDDWGWKL